MSRQTAATADATEWAVFNTVVIGTAHRTHSGLALVPETDVKTRNTGRRGEVFGQGDLDHARTRVDIGHTRVGLLYHGVDHTKSTEENFEAIVGNLHRQVTYIDQTRTGVDWGETERSATKIDTTGKGRITLSGLLVRHTNKAIWHELNTTDIGQVQGLDQFRKNFRRTRGPVDLRREVQRQCTWALYIGHGAPKLSPATQGTKLAGRPKKHNQENYRVELGVHRGLIPGCYLALSTPKKTILI